MSGQRRASGCMFGLAYGDAPGRATEFKTYDQALDEPENRVLLYIDVRRRHTIVEH